MLGFQDRSIGFCQSQQYALCAQDELYITVSSAAALLDLKHLAIDILTETATHVPDVSTQVTCEKATAFTVAWLAILAD